MFVFLNLRTPFSNVNLDKDRMVPKSSSLEFWFWRYDVKPNFSKIFEPIGKGFIGSCTAPLHVHIFESENIIFQRKIARGFEW